MRTVDPSTTVAAGRRAGRATRCSCPPGLPEDYRATSARTDAGNAERGRPGDAGDRLPDAVRGVRRVRRQRRPRRRPGRRPCSTAREEQGTVDDRRARPGPGRPPRRGETALVPGGRRGDRRWSPGRRRTRNCEAVAAAVEPVLGLTRPAAGFGGASDDLWRTSRHGHCLVRRVSTRGGSRDSSVPPVTRVTRAPLKEPPCPLVFSAPAATTGHPPPAVRVPAGW